MIYEIVVRYLVYKQMSNLIIIQLCNKMCGCGYFFSHDSVQCACVVSQNYF